MLSWKKDAKCSKNSITWDATPNAWCIAATCRSFHLFAVIGSYLKSSTNCTL
jgi:hypothetical protein